jgi:hypothetical protein
MAMSRRQQARASAPTEPSNRLPVLIAEIKQYEGLARNHGKAWLMTRLDEGDRLREPKDSVEHGRWLPLLRELGIHEMRARRYMRLAEHRTLIEARIKSDSESDLGLTDALNYITDLEEQKRRAADKEYQAERQKREKQNRKLLAQELERRAAEAAKLKANPRPEIIPGREPPPPPAAPASLARAVTGFTHCVRNCFTIVGGDQRAEFLKQARGVLDAMEAERAAPDPLPLTEAH